MFQVIKELLHRVGYQAISNVLHLSLLLVSHALIIQCLNCVHDKLRQYCDKIETSRMEGDFAAVAETGKISAELTNQADAIFGGTECSSHWQYFEYNLILNGKPSCLHPLFGMLSHPAWASR